MSKTAAMRLGSTYGLSRVGAGDECDLWAEQVYVNRIVDPVKIPHPDAADPRYPKHLAERTIQIVRANGYSFPAVLELTDRQAIEMAHIILRALDPDYKGAHPQDQWNAGVLRSQAKTIAATLNHAADVLEGSV